MRMFIETKVHSSAVASGPPQIRRTLLNLRSGMKQFIFIISLGLFFEINSARASFFKPPEPNKYEGDKPYTPTRLEWLTTYNQNECGIWLNLSFIFRPPLSRQA